MPLRSLCSPSVVLAAAAGLALGAASVIAAQTTAPGPALPRTAIQPAQSQPFSALPEPVVLSGEDVGFRIEGMVDGVPAGRIVVRNREGQWVEPRQLMRVVPLSAE